MRTSIVFVIIIILVINSNQKLLSYHVNENFSRFCDNYYLCHIFISPSLFWITPTKEIWSYHANENFYRLRDYYYSCHKLQPKTTVLSREMRSSLAFVIIIIFVIYLYHPHFDITPTKEIWSYHANENFYRLCDYYYSCHKLQPKTTVLSREWEVLSHLW